MGFVFLRLVITDSTVFKATRLYKCASSDFVYLEASKMKDSQNSRLKVCQSSSECVCLEDDRLYTALLCLSTALLF